MLFKHISKKKTLLLIGDIVLISVAYLLSPMIRFRFFLFTPFQSVNEWIIILFIYLISFYTADLYALEMKFFRARYLFRYLMAMFVAIIMVLSASVFYPRIIAGHGALPLIDAGLVFVLTYSWRLVFERIFQRYLKRGIRTIIVGAGQAGRKTYQLIRNHPDTKIIGFIDDDRKSNLPANSPPVLGDFSTLDELVRQRQVDQIIITVKHLKNQDLCRRSIEYIQQGIRVSAGHTFYEEVIGKIPVDQLTDQWVISTSLQGINPNIYNLRVKRLLDMVLSVIGIILSAPIIIIAGLCICVDSKGPVLFKQTRIGLVGKGFKLLKLRTMKVGTDQDLMPANGLPDPRITRVGRVMRKMRLDELPQFWNVLIGQMSLIGPRALMKEEVELFEREVPYFALRHVVKPGITGWAQVNYPHGNSVEDALEKVQYDLFYIKNLSFFLDFHVVMRTIRVMLFAKGAK
ncbi:MAG: sugar transferase [Syntrophales bacterium]|nr:sugar transferase [Syntrophales bacterium]